MNVNDKIKMPCGTEFTIESIQHESLKANQSLTNAQGKEPYIYIEITLTDIYGLIDGEERELDSISLTFQRRSVDSIIKFFTDVKKELEIVEP